jgi:hypothetical protein
VKILRRFLAFSPCSFVTLFSVFPSHQPNIKMKKLAFTLHFVLLAGYCLAQLANDNTASVKIDGKDFNTAPRRIKFGNYYWFTANTVNPDKSLRVWLGRYDGKEVTESGTYLVIDLEKGTQKYSATDYAKYKGIAAIKYVEETRSPRMEYHMGKSNDVGETFEVKMGADGFLEATFSKITLEGSHWKEKTAATVFGGVGRLVDKAKDKAKTSATGYDYDIDPEGNGYKRTDKTDNLVLTDGKFRFKMK